MASPTPPPPPVIHSSSPPPPPSPLCPCLMDLLHDDALRNVLLWTRASDHFPLRLTCRRLLEILQSSTFRLERCQGGFAEVKAVLATPNSALLSYQRYQRYDEDYDDYDEIGFRDSHFGYHSNDAFLLVDGVQAGAASFTLLPRGGGGGRRQHTRRTNFHSMADSLSDDELLTMATTFFDAKGRPRLPSLQQALHKTVEPNDEDDDDDDDDNDDDDDSSSSSTSHTEAGFLYLSFFQWYDPIYRTNPWIGAMALRALLTETPLRHQWSLVAYIPNAQAQFQTQDQAAEKQYWAFKSTFVHVEMMDLELLQDAEEQRQDELWQQRCYELTKRDMQQFFHAGFRQVPETIYERTCFHVYAVPSQLISNRPPLPEDQEEEDTVAILEKPHDKRSQPCHNESMLVQLIRVACQSRQRLVDWLHDLQRMNDSPLDNPLVRKAQELNQLEDPCIAFREIEEECVKQQAELMERSQGADEETLQLVQQGQERIRCVLEESLPAQKQKWISGLRDLAASQKAMTEAQLQELDDQLRSEMVRLVKDQYDGNTDFLERSEVLHACAYSLEPEYLSLVMSLIPNEKKQQQAINAIGRSGMTPLMTAASRIQGDHHHSSTITIAKIPETCRTLIRMGADKSIVDTYGLTALGRFRNSCRDLCDFQVMGNSVDQQVSEELQAIMPSMEALLLPFRGASLADDAVLKELQELDDEVIAGLLLQEDDNGDFDEESVWEDDWDDDDEDDDDAEDDEDDYRQ